MADARLAHAKSGAFRSARQWPLWTYVVLLLAGTFAFVASDALNHSMPAGFWVITIVWVIALAGIVALIIGWLDMYGGNRRELLAAGFLWGALAAPGFAAPIDDRLTKLIDNSVLPFHDVTDAAEWALGEEALKGIGVVLIVLIGRRYLERPFQVAVLGAATGLGFQFTENISYMINAGSGSGDTGTASSSGSHLGDLISMGISRTVSALDTHWLLTGIIGLGIGYALVRRDRPVYRRALAVAVAAAGSWLAHFAVDSPMAQGFVIVVVLLAILVVAYVAVYRPAMAGEWRRTAAVAVDEPDDVIAPDDVEALRTRRKRRAARRAVNTTAVKAGELQGQQLELVNAVLRGDGTAAELRQQVRRTRMLSYPDTRPCTNAAT